MILLWYHKDTNSGFRGKTKGENDMSKQRSSFKMGTVEMLILFLLEKRDMYGYELSSNIKNLSNGKITISESTLYPTLYKLLDKKYISDSEKLIGKRRIRVYYHLEKDGVKRLADLLEDYRSITEGIESILSYTNTEEKEDDKQ